MHPPTSSSSIRSISQPRTDVVTLLHNAAAGRHVDTRTRRLRWTATRPHRHRFRHQSQRCVSTGREIRRRLRVRSTGPLLALFLGRDEPELLARRAGSGRERQGHFSEYLPGLLCGALAAYPLRGVSEPRGGGERREQAATSQIALPKSACDSVYATSGYSSSVTNLSQVSLATDGIFRDGASLELATVNGSVSDGLTATLTVAI